MVDVNELELEALEAATEPEGELDRGVDPEPDLALEGVDEYVDPFDRFLTVRSLASDWNEPPFVLTS